MVDVDRAPEPDDLLAQFIDDEWTRTRRATQPADNAHDLAGAITANLRLKGLNLSIQPDLDALNQQRITERIWEWARAGREAYKAEAKGDHPIRPSDLIRQAEETK